MADARCTGCGKSVKGTAIVVNRDAADVEHTWHSDCWTKMRGWLKQPSQMKGEDRDG